MNMNALILPATRTTPGVHFEPATGLFELTGTSVPEDASEFYQPVIQWLAQHLHYLKGEQVVHFHLSYFNSSSLKAIYQLLVQVKAACTMGASIRVCWHAEPDDDLVLDTVATLSDVLDMPMDFIPIEDDKAKAAG